MALRDGQSSLDQITLRVPEKGIEINNWLKYSFTQSFLIPCAAWSFTLPPDMLANGVAPGIGNPSKLFNGVFELGDKVEISLNDRVQCTGYVEKITSESSGGGTQTTIQGRDILGPVVDSCIDPAFKFTAGSTLLDVALSILKPFGIDTIYNADDLNINVISGSIVPKPSTKSIVKVKNAEGVATSTGKSVVSSKRKDLKTIKVDQIKPRMGEGTQGFLDRVFRRFGYVLVAAADGSGIIAVQPDFTRGDPGAEGQLIHRVGIPDGNNIISGTKEDDLISQPSIIVGFGRSKGRDADHSSLKVIMVNELVGQVLGDFEIVESQIVKDIKARYPGAKVLPIRPELEPLLTFGRGESRATPMFFKDDESNTIEQLEAFVRREMAERQQKSRQLTYVVPGHTYKGAEERNGSVGAVGYPWAINTTVNVFDDVLAVEGPYWVLEKTFRKSRSSGTTTELRLIRPYTLQLA